MKNIKIIRQVILTIFFLTSLSNAKSINYLDFAAVSDILGYTISHENFKQKDGKQVDISRVQKKLNTYLKDSGFKFKSVHMPFQEKEGNDLYIEGIMLHSDDINRHIDTKFKAYCLIENNLITVTSIELKNNLKPRGAFYIIPSSKINIKQLKKMNFKEALKKVNSINHTLENFNPIATKEPIKYEILAFMMNKVNNDSGMMSFMTNKLSSDDEIYSVLSDSPFSTKGVPGKIISTKDDWKILTLETTFDYNNIPKYFNIFLQKDDYLLSSESFSTQGLVKSIKIALSKRGYDAGVLDNVLNKNTKQAIKKYLKALKFDTNSKITQSMLWFIQQQDIKDVSKILQSTLIINGIDIGTIDGKMGSGTLKGIKKYQKQIGLKTDGKVTPELVRLLIQTSINIDIYNRLEQNYNRPIFIDQYHNKMWPNKLF